MSVALPFSVSLCVVVCLFPSTFHARAGASTILVFSGINSLSIQYRSYGAKDTIDRSKLMISAKSNINFDEFVDIILLSNYHTIAVHVSFGHPCECNATFYQTTGNVCS